MENFTERGDFDMAFGDKNHPVKRDDLENIVYHDSEGNELIYPVYGQGPHRTVARIVDGSTEVFDQLAYDKDQNVGFTSPNLHRRVDPQEPPKPEDPNYDPDDPDSVDRSYLNQEIKPRDYELSVQGVHSYRTTTYNVHDEESITTEIP